MAGGSARESTTASAANVAVFEAVDMKAVSVVGAPWYTSGVHMWNGTALTLKKKPTSSSADAGQEQARPPGLGDARGQLVEQHRARRAVQQRDAVEEEAGREGAQQEVLQRALVRRRLLADEPGQDVEADRHRLQPDEQRDQAAGRGQRHHARRGEQDERVHLAVVPTQAREVRDRERDAGDGAEQDDEVRDGGRAADEHLPVERRPGVADGQRLPDARERHPDARDPGDRRVVVAEAVEQHHEHAEGGDQQDGAGGGEVGEERVVHEGGARARIGDGRR